MHLLQTPLRDTRPFHQKALRTLLALPSIAALLILLLGLNALETLSLVIRPFSRTAFRNVCCGLTGHWWTLLVILLEEVHGYRLQVTGDLPVPKENAIVIANHQEMMDIPVILMFAQRQGQISKLKWFAKAALKYVPGIGWGMAFIDCVFLARNWADDRASILATFEKFHTRKIPFWLVAFPEGTRIRPQKLAKSQALARARGYPVLEHVMLPKTRGFCAAVTGLRQDAQAVYELTIAYDGGIPSLLQAFTGAAPGAHLHVRRHAIKDLPEDENSLSEWLRARFVEKDQWLAERIRS